MVGKIRESLNEAPPWVSYTIGGVVLVAAVGLMMWRLGGDEAQASTGDKHFYCEECERGFTLTADEARARLRQATRENPSGRGASLKCPQCGKFNSFIGLKCPKPKCNAYFLVPKPGTLEPDAWKDECPKCGYSPDRAEAVKYARELKKEGKYDPDTQPEYIRKAVEDAEESGE